MLVKERKGDPQAAEVFIDLILQIALQLINAGIKKEEAVTISKDSILFVMRHWSGQFIYFSAKKLQIALLTEELKKFDGGRQELAFLSRIHGVSTSHAYSLLTQIRKNLELEKQTDVTEN
jgi:hypothetical protein